METREYIESLTLKKQLDFLKKELEIEKFFMRENFDNELDIYRNKYFKFRTDFPRPDANTFFNVCNQICNNIVESKLKIVNKSIYLFKDNYGWIHLKNISINKLKDLFTDYLCMFINDNKYNRLINQLIDKISVEKITNRVIQFNNGYFNKRDFVFGVYEEEVSKYFIAHTYEESKSDISKCPEFIDFVKHLSNDNVGIENFIYDSMAMLFINDVEFRAKNSILIRMYGPSGENGKLTFTKLLSNILVTPNNSYSVDFEDLATNKNYELSNAINKLFLYDPDSKSSYISSNVASILKKLVSAEEITVREIYGKPIQSHFDGVIFIMSNHPFQCEQKDDGVSRRICQIIIDNKLEKNDKWFDELLFNKDKLDIIRNFLIKRAIDITRSKERKIVIPGEIEKLKKELFYGNNNVLAFIEEYGREYFINCSAKFIYKEYEHWCDNNCMNPYGLSNFNKTIESELKLQRKSIPVKKISYNDDEFFNLRELQPNHRIHAWVE